MRRMRTGVAGVVVALAVAATLGGCATDGGITRGRLQAAVGPTFQRMYLLQQSIEGHQDPYTRPDTSVASCTRGGPSTPDDGPGADWICVVHWPSPSGITEPVAYDVSVQPGGCYTAEGPATTVGQQTIPDGGGKSVPNPLLAFDGCLRIG